MGVHARCWQTRAGKETQHASGHQLLRACGASRADTTRDKSSVRGQHSCCAAPLRCNPPRPRPAPVVRNDGRELRASLA
eukprot:12538494-Alexandrium_andersonii.AAC.1